MFYIESYDNNFRRLLVDVYLLIISVVLLEWVCGQMIFLSDVVVSYT